MAYFKTRGSAIANVYATIAAMLADQGTQVENSYYWVTDATTDGTVTSGWAIYRKLGTSTGVLANYVKVQEQESMDLIAGTGTVSAGTAGQVAVYAAGGTTVSGLTQLPASNLPHIARTITAGTSLVQADDYGIIYVNSATNINITVDQLTLNSRIELLNIGVGDVTFINGTGVTFTGDSVMKSGENAVILYKATTTPLISAGGGGSVGGVTISGIPTSGQVPIAISATDATWQTLAGSIGGSIAAGQVALGNGVNTISGSSTFYYDLASSFVKLKTNTDYTLLMAENTSSIGMGAVYGINNVSYQTYVGTKGSANGYNPNVGILYSNAPNGLVISANNSGSLMLRAGFADLNRIIIDYLGAVTIPSLASGTIGVLKMVTTDAYGLTGTQTIPMQTLNVNTSSATNSGTAETDLYRYTVPFNTLLIDGYSIESKISGSFSSSANNKTLRVYFGPTKIFDSGAFVFSSGTNYWTIDIQIIRTGAATEKCNVLVTTNNSTAYTMVSYSTAIATLNINNDLYATVQVSGGTDEVTKETAKTIVIR